VVDLGTIPRDRLLAFRRSLGPSFVNRQQEAFFDARTPEVLYSGAFRAGKSRIGCEKGYWLAKQYPGLPVGIFRKYAVTLAPSTERTLLHDVIPVGEIVRSNASQRWYELANGSRIWLFGLDPDPITGLPSKIGSVELGWAFIDEAAEVTEADWTMVKGRLSWPGIPFHQISGATNPASPKHWLKQRFTPPDPDHVYLHASTLDNPALPRDYVSAQMAISDSYLRRRYVLGEWVAAEGQIWLLPDAQISSPEQQPYRRVVAGIDWGFVHAFACEVVAQTGSGRLAVVDEVYVKGETLDQIIPALRFLQERHGITQFVADPSEPAFILQLQRAGLRVAAAQNDVIPGIQAVSKALASGMTVAPSCLGLLGEIPGYTWQSSRNGMTERPIEIGDDACDALRYAVMHLTAARGGWSAVTGSAGGIA
jgi:PBSX family phage terminase large subunit